MLLDAGIEKGQIILIYGEPRIGKLVFSLFAITHYLHSPRTAFFSPIMPDLMEKRFQGIREIKDGLINNFLNSPQFAKFFFKEEYPSLKKQYSPLYLLDDIKKGVETTGAKAIILHRFEYFFEIQEFDDAEKFFQELIRYVQLKNLKLFLTFSPNDRFVNVPELIDNSLELRIDIEVIEDKRITNVKYTVHPIAEKIYFFKRTERGLELTPRNKEILEEQKRYSVSIHSSDRWLEKSLKYILHPDKFQIYEGNKITDFIHALFKGYEIIFFYDESREFDLDYCRIVKENNLPSRIIYILNKDFVRSGDRINAVDEGCYELFPRTFGIEDLVLTLKRIVGDEFYNLRNLKLPHQNFTTEWEQFCSILKVLLEGRIFFSYIKGTLNGDGEQVVGVMRRSDYLHWNKKDKKVHFIFLNVRETIARNVVIPNLEKRINMDIKIEKVVEAPEIIKNPIC